MARYERRKVCYMDADKLMAYIYGLAGKGKPIDFVTIRQLKSAIAYLEEMHPADVVPKSEVEQLRHKYDLAVAEREANVKGFTEELSKAKAEVAREIFEEIERNIVNLETPYQILHCIPWGYITETKKKYTEPDAE